MSKPVTRKAKIRALHHHQARKTWVKDARTGERLYEKKKGKKK